MSLLCSNIHFGSFDHFLLEPNEDATVFPADECVLIRFDDLVEVRVFNVDVCDRGAGVLVCVMNIDLGVFEFNLRRVRTSHIYRFARTHNSHPANVLY